MRHAQWAQWFVSLALGPILGCGKVTSSTPDAPASLTCDPLGTFAAPKPVLGLELPGSPADATLSADELTLYLTRNTAAGDRDMYVASRPEITAPFAAPMPLVSLNSASDDAAPSISADGLTMLFQSDRVAAEGMHLYVTTRPSPIADFSAAALVGGVRSAVVTADDLYPFLTPDGQELWFVSNRTGGPGTGDIYRSARTGTGFGTPVLVPELSSPSAEQHIVVSQDGLTVYFSSNRPNQAGSTTSGFNIYRSHRSTLQDGFGTPAPVPELNTVSDDHATWLSADGCRLYLHNKPTTSFKLFVATRQPSS